MPNQECVSVASPRPEEESESSEGPFRPTHPWTAAFIGHATVSALFRPRTASEGPVLVLENPEFEVVRGCTEIPFGAAGVMAFDAGPVVLARAVWVSLTSEEGPQVKCDGPLPVWRDTNLGYVVKSPINYERFIVVGKKFAFKVRAGQPGWKLAAGPVRDEATAAYLNLHLLR